MGKQPGYSTSNSDQPESAAQAKSPNRELIGTSQMEAHMSVSTYGSFDLTDAVRPAMNLEVIPRQGFRHDCYVDPQTGSRMPVIMAAASRHRIFDLFVDLIEPLGDVLDVVLETSHQGAQGGHKDLYREHIDRPVLLSVLYDFEDLLLNDGCTGIAVLNPTRLQEVQFDEHKMLICYGQPLGPFEQTMIRHDVYPDPQMQFITEGEHVHTSSDKLHRQFEQLRFRLGIDH
jgi:hypothetical protein